MDRTANHALNRRPRIATQTSWRIIRAVPALCTSVSINLSKSNMESTEKKIRVQIGDSIVVTEKVGTPLIDLCDNHRTPIPFSCREGACGTCLIEVLSGSENLSPLTEMEEIVLDEMTDAPNARLACQTTLLGNVHVVPLDP